MQETINGVIHDPEVLEVQPPPRLSPRALGRLSRLQARTEGSGEAAQAAVNVHNMRMAAYREAFEDACADAGIPIPPGEHDVQIDWNTGEVRFGSNGNG